MRYLYCPRCGRKLTPRPAGDDGLVPYCDDCGQYWFDSFASCVIVLVANEFREIAMLRQSYLSDEYWSYVAGFITPGETAEQTAFREVREELGLELERLEYGGTFWFSLREQLMHGFIGFVKKADFTLSGEVTGPSGSRRPRPPAACSRRRRRTPSTPCTASICRWWRAPVCCEKKKKSARTVV